MQSNQIRELKLEKLRRYKEEKYRYYVPIGKVEEFLDGFMSGNYFVSLLSAANGIGKTTAIANILAHLFWPVGNEFFQQPMMKHWPYKIRKGRIVSDPTTVTETLIPAFEEWFPQGRYTRSKMGKRYDYRWETDTGWTFDVMTYEQSPKEFESANLSFALFDEPPPEVIYKATVARMREGGTIGIFATPLMGSAWMYDEVIANQDNESVNRFYITADVEEACEEHGVRGFLKHDNIVKMVNQYDDEDMQARIFGRFQHLTGLVFKKFKPDIHVIEPFHIDNSFTVLHALDTHPRNPDAVLWKAIDAKGNMFIIDELYHSGTIGELVQAIKNKDDHYRVVKRLIDPSAYVQDQHTGRSWASDLLQYGLTYEPGSKRRMDAVQKIKDSLHYIEKNGEIIVAPQIYIFSSCTRLIWEMQHWQWSEHSGRSKEVKHPSEKPQDKDDHMIENLGRLLLDTTEWRSVEAYNTRVSDYNNQQAVNSYDPYNY